VMLGNTLYLSVPLPTCNMRMVGLAPAHLMGHYKDEKSPYYIKHLAHCQALEC
jgi:hypothetical protein